MLDLVVDDEGDELDEQERAVLNTAISRARASLKAGYGRSAAEVIDAIWKQ